jgi:hypothetical protein
MNEPMRTHMRHEPPRHRLTLLELILAAFVAADLFAVLWLISCL